MASMAYEDTLRLLLQNKFERIENLVQMNHAATLAVPSVLATIWGIDGWLNQFENVWILGIISIGLLLLWRYFAHYLDNDIAKTYIDIVKIENRLGVPPEISMFDRLIDSLTTNQKVKQLDDDQKVKFLECLNKNKMMGYRGHDKWDNIAFVLIGLCVVASISAVFHPVFLRIIHILLSHFQWIDYLTMDIAFFGLVFLFGLVITCITSKIFKNFAQFQRKPTELEIQFFYDKIITTKNCITD